MPTDADSPGDAVSSSRVDPPVLWVRTGDAAGTQALAAQLAADLADGDVIVLAGDLGAGKTCFTQGLARGLGIADRVTSPTFTLAQRYRGRLELNHLDVYRLDDLADTLDLDLPELMESGVTVIEWGERILPVLGSDLLVIRLWLDDDDDDARWVQFVATGPRWTEARLRTAIGGWCVGNGPNRETSGC